MVNFKEISLIKRKKKKSKKSTYDIVVVVHKKISDKVIVKLGSYDKNNKLLVLNIFRLIFWLSKNCFMSYKLMKLFQNINFFDFNYFKNIND